MSFEPKVNVLLVDDHQENLLALEGILDSLGQNLVRATSGAEALRRLLNQDFAVILLDVQMPDMDGFETAALIRQRERSRHTPIIFLTAFSTSDNMVFKGYSLGAVDYLFKPIEPEILKSKVAAFVDLFQKSNEVKRQAAQLQVMNAELKKREEMFRSLSACSPVGIFVTDTEGKYTYTNPRYQAIYGMTLEESLGEGWVRTIHPEDQERAVAEWYAAFGEGRQYRGDFRILTSEGIERWVCMSSSPMLSDKGEVIGYVGTLEDITERKQAEQEHIKLIREQTARQEAETANRLKDEFLATLSHELRTPLTSILGWAKLLRQRKLDEKAIVRALETIERNASVQAQLIDDILDVSRIIRGKLHLHLCPVNLASVISVVIDSVRLEAEAKNILLEYVIQPNAQESERWEGAAPSPVLVSGDPNRLQQIVWNLLNNALKFTPSGGKVEVQLSLEESREEYLLSELKPQEHQKPVEGQDAALAHQTKSSLALIKVSDTGSGISSDFLPHVFDRFRQADGSITRNQGGLGLGLAIVRYLVEMHGGSVCAQSPGFEQGSTFTVILPLLETAGQKDRETKKGTPTHKPPSPPLLLTESPLNGLQVLVVEDDTDTRDYVSTLLQQSGANVTAVASARLALSAIKQSPPDVLVSDIGMPEEDGYSLIRKLRNLEPDKGGQIPAIALTAYVREQDCTQALESGFQMYISKPVEPANLINLVAKLAQSNLTLSKCQDSS